MRNFDIGKQVKQELEDFYKTRLVLATTKKTDQNLRYLKNDAGMYSFNQAETLALIDLYYSSQFENGPFDSQGKRKMFINIGVFRCEVASKQIDLDTKDFRFIPDDYADPWTAYFMQKDFKEWSKESEVADLLNSGVDNFPKYGHVVLKEVGNTIADVPLQNIKCKQDAKSLKESPYVIEEHPGMYIWEMEDMKNWDCERLDMNMSDTKDVYERYGRVPLGWLKKINNEEATEADWKKYVDAMVIMCWIGGDKDGKSTHVFFAEQIRKRPYRERRWRKVRGRWLGAGVMEDLVENQRAANIVANLTRRSMQWSGKRVLQSRNADNLPKNLAMEVEDGEVLAVGTNGEITSVDLSAKYNADFSAFLQMWEKNSDQKAFTYDVATGASLPSGTPFKLGALLDESVSKYFDKKREVLALLYKEAIMDFMIPQFIKDMGNESRISNFFSDEPGYEALKAAAMDFMRSEACRISIFSGKPINPQTLIDAVEPFEAVNVLFFQLPKDAYKNAKYKFDLDITGESVDLKAKVEALWTLYQILAGKGDPRAQKVLERIGALTGNNFNTFGPAAPLTPPAAAGAPEAAAPAAPQYASTGAEG